MDDPKLLNVNASLDEVEKWAIPAGTIICCPHCRMYVGQVTREIRHGTKLTSDLFRGPGIEHGGKTTCKRCGMPWFLAAVGRFHTDRGWKPDGQRGIIV